MVPLMLTVLPPCVKFFIFRLQATSLHLAQVNHAIQQGINVSGYNSPFAKLSKNATFFFCKVDCCNILSKYAIRTRRNLHIDQNTPQKRKKKKSQIMFLHITAKANNLEGWKICKLWWYRSKEFKRGREWKLFMFLIRYGPTIKNSKKKKDFEYLFLFLKMLHNKNLKLELH